MVDVIFKYSNDAAFWNRLASLGMAERKDEEGNRLKIQDRGFKVMTPVLVDINGDSYQRARMDAGDADKFPTLNNPAFTIVWRSAENDNIETLVEVNNYGIDGNLDGTRMQSVGGF